ncbi:cwf18 pre-mRNA splicing factor-domain-containing protein [Durotheca rogersii]|uniref:cwf18 pre-mRNA splicing factor-domain-containing protein n=1 Tax=Durotheca rogersii TaxID=419775 RepID=UPI00221FB357|nr:cwf18 pre-mRNA splicing factor-domain-containing protein [Durotheca rogersii]KAI5857344.1 cwf18 pre-mRNA splicing factor-domain-containing protein [Durotheca rogersii]
MSTSHATLSAASDDRKARLAKLKTLKRKQPADELATPELERERAAASTTPQPPQPASAAEDGPDVSRLHLSGRNYDAATRGPKLGFEAPPTAGMEGPTLEEHAAAVEAEVRRLAANDAVDDRGIDLFKLQPRRPNWDLRRDLDAKLAVLNVRTDNAIARLVRERIGGTQAAAEQQQRQNAGRGNEAAPKGPTSRGGDEEAEEVTGIDGVALVEGLRVREREDQRAWAEDEDSTI